MAGLLSRARIVAGPGFNRWLVPPAALAIHLSIGQAYAFSVFKLPLTKVMGITDSAAADWKQTELAWIFTIAIVFLGLVGRRVRPVAGARRSPEERRGGRLLLGAGLLHLRPGRPAPQHLAAVPGLRRARRLRARPGLHHARLHPDQVVPRPPGHGYGHGDHGLRRRGDDREPAVATAAGPLRVADLGRGRRDLRHDGRDLLRRHDVGRLPVPGARAGLEAGGLEPAGRGSHDAHHPAPRPRGRRDQDRRRSTALGGAVPQRDGGHRDPRAGLADDPGDVQGRREAQRRRGVRRAAEPVQHGRPVRLELAVGPDRAQADVRRLLHPGADAVPAAALRGPDRQRGAVRRLRGA